MNNKRIEFVDVYKSIGIILMILGHINFGYFNYFIHAFHMPMFFIISGYLYSKKDFSKENTLKFIYKKFKQLIIPYLFFAFFHLFFNYIINHDFSMFALRSIFNLNSEYMVISIALWFLTALFFADIIFFLISKYISKYFNTILFVLLGIIGTILYSKYKILLPLSINQSFVGTFFMFIGSKLNNKYTDKILNINILYLIPFIILEVYLIKFNPYVNIRINLYKYIPLFYFNAILSSIIILVISYKIHKYFNNLYTIKYLEFIGKTSIVFVCLNHLIIHYFARPYISRLQINNFLLNKILVFILTMIALSSISLILNKSKLRFIIGK